MKKYFIVLADNYGSSNCWTEFIPIGVIEEKNEDSIREVLVHYITTELHLNNDECDKMIAEVLPELMKTGRYNDVDAEVMFKIYPAPLFKK